MRCQHGEWPRGWIQVVHAAYRGNVQIKCPAMSRLNVVLLLSVAFSLLSAPSLAQMTKPEYEEYLVKVDAVKEHCDKFARSINIEKLNLSYAMGKQIEIAKHQILEMVNTIGVLKIQIRSTKKFNRRY